MYIETSVAGSTLGSLVIPVPFWLRVFVGQHFVSIAQSQTLISVDPVGQHFTNDYAVHSHSFPARSSKNDGRVSVGPFEHEMGVILVDKGHLDIFEKYIHTFKDQEVPIRRQA